MAKHTLVAVGGSGQSAAIAYLRLATISGMSPDLLPNIYVIDADIKDRQGAEAKPSLFSSLQALFSKLVQGVADNRKPKLELIYPYNQGQANDVLSSSTTFADYILAQGGKKEEMRQVVDALFSKKNNTRGNHLLSEQDVPLSKGFMARPNVGATTFFDKLHQDRNSLEPALHRLRDTVTNGQSQSITVVIGSSFGGTGSGVAPSLAQQLVQWAEEADQKPLVALFMTLPWFNPIEQQTQNNAAPTHGSRAAQLKNTAGGLRYYATSETFKRMDVFVADYCGHIHARNDDSNSEQPEYEHVFNILLASQIQNYFINKMSHPSFIDKAGAYTFFQSQQGNSHTLHFDAADSPLLGFAVDSKLKQDIKHWAHEAQSLRLALRYSADFISNDFRLSDASTKREKPEGFNILAVEVAKKDGRPSMLIETKKFGFLKGADQPAQEIYKAIAEKLREREKQLANSIAWLNKLSANCPELHIDDLSINAHPDLLYKQYTAMKADRNVDVASTRLFEEALGKPNAKTLQSFELRVDNGQHALDAAAEEIEEQIRKVIRQYNVVPRNQDEQVQPSMPGRVNALFIPMHVGNSGQVINSYLQSLDLKTLVDDGKNRAGDEVNKQDKSHPASLNELCHFSIPSPWGVALIEQWNQDSAFAMLQKNPQLMQDAANRLEAILWAIFTKKIVVKNITSNVIGSIVSTAIRVRNMETSTKDGDNNMIAVAVNPLTGQLVAANYPSVGWFAAPTQTGILREWWDDDGDLFMQLPSEISLDSQRMLATAYEARLIKSFTEWMNEILDKVDSNNTMPAASWIPVLQYIQDRLTDRIPKATESLNLPATTEIFLLQNRKEVLQIPIVHVTQFYDDIIDDACCTNLIVLENEKKDGSFDYKRPDSPLKTTTKGTAKLLSSSGILKEHTGSGSYMNLTYQLNLDDSEFIVKRKAKVVFIRVQQVVWPNFKADGWQFYYAGGTATDNQDLINQASPQYAYYLYTNQSDGSRTRVQYLQGDEVKEFTTPLYFDRNYELYGVPDELVLLERIAGIEQYQEVGIIETKLIKFVEERNNRFKLALDFGTSHSCVVALDASGRKIPLIDFTRSSAENDLICNVIETSDGPEYLFEEFRFIAPFAARESIQDLDRNVLPSEFRNNSKLLPYSPIKEIETGIRYLTILPMQFKNPRAEKNIKDTGALGDFKWGASKKSSSLTTTFYEDKESELSRLYIKQLLRIAITMLRAQGYRQLTTFRATFPEAFTTQHTALFAKELEVIFSQISRETDLIIEHKVDQSALVRLKDFIQGTLQDEQGLTEISHGLVSESMAALKTTSKTSERNVLSDKKLQIVLDMGGGSTDIAAFLSDDVLQKSNGKKLPMQLTDSIRYAGHDILQLLSTVEITTKLDEQFKYDDKKELLQQCMRVIKIAMRDAKAVHRLQTHLVNPDFAVTAKRNVKDFFEGLFEYTRQLIESYQSILREQGIENLSVGIVLLGNGWRLGNLVYTNVDLNTVEGLKHAMQEYLKNGLSNIESLSVIFPSSSNISVKESIAYGSLLYDPTQEMSRNIGESVYGRTRYSFIGGSKLKFMTKEMVQMQQEELSGFVKQQKLADRRDPLNAPQIEEIASFPESSSFLSRMNNVKGQEGQGLHFAKIDLNKRLQMQWRSSEEEVMISPMKDFLECIWKPLLLEEI